MSIEPNRTWKKYTEELGDVRKRTKHKPGARSLCELARETESTPQKLSRMLQLSVAPPKVLFRGGKTGNRPHYDHDTFLRWYASESSNTELTGAAPTTENGGMT